MRRDGIRRRGRRGRRRGGRRNGGTGGGVVVLTCWRICFEEVADGRQHGTPVGRKRGGDAAGVSIAMWIRGLTDIENDVLCVRVLKGGESEGKGKGIIIKKRLCCCGRSGKESCLLFFPCLSFLNKDRSAVGCPVRVVRCGHPPASLYYALQIQRTKRQSDRLRDEI